MAKAKQRNVSPASLTSLAKRASIAAGKSVLSVAIEDYKNGIEKFAGMFSGNYGVRVVFRGTQAMTNGKTIIVPDISLLERKNMTEAEVKEATDYLIVTRGYVYHEGAHIMFTDFTDAIFRRVQALGKKFHNLFNALEDGRVERKVSVPYQGAKEILMFTHRFVYDEVLSIFREKKKKNEKIAPWLHLLYGILLWSALGDQGRKHPLWKELDLHARRRVRRLAPLISKAVHARNTDKCERIAEEIWKQLKEEKEEEKPKDEQQSQDKDEQGSQPDRDDADPGDDGGDEEQDDDTPKKKKKKKSKQDDDAKEDESDDDSDSGSDDDESEAGDSDDESESGDEEDESERSDSEHSDGDEDEESDDDEGDGRDASDSDDDDGEEEDEGGASEDEDEADSSERYELDKDGPDDEPRDTDKSLTEKIQQAAKTTSRDVYRVYSTEQDIISYPQKTSETTEAHKRAFIAELDAQTRAIYGPLVRSLENVLKARTQSYYVRGLEEGAIDQGRLHNVAIAGRTRNPDLLRQSRRVFKKKVHTMSLDSTAVAVTVDRSGSMGGYGTSLERKDRLAMKCADIFGNALCGVGIPFEVTTWSTNHTNYWTDLFALSQDVSKPPEVRQRAKTELEIYHRFCALNFTVIKGFNDDWRRMRGNIMHMKAQHANIDGESIWLATLRLLQRQEKRKIVFVLSDGMPSGHGGDSFQMTNRHLHETVARIRRAGVEVYGVGIGAPQVAEFYKPNFVNVNDTGALPKVMVEHLRSVLRLG